jgi:serine/threonine-protein kinase RsbW
MNSERVNQSGSKRLSFTLATTWESVTTITEVATKLAKDAGLDEDKRFGVALATHEAAVNAVLHGNRQDPDKQMTVSFENTGDSLVITIADQGQGICPDSLPDPLAPANLLRKTGRGIFLIRSFMDEVHIRPLQPGTELTLIKHLGKQPQQST